MDVKLAMRIGVLLVAPATPSLRVLSQGSAPAARTQAESGQRAATSTSSASPLCRAEGKEEITIRCNYTEAPRPISSGFDKPRIVLNRMVLSFKTDEDSYMLVELTFTNGSTVPITRTVYLAIDDDAGRNYMRRPLPQVDFRKIAPGEQLKFSDRLLAPALRPGHYTIQLWIPNPDPSLKFDPLHNFLLSNAGMANPATGLNKLAVLAVVP
jgi:hypothetical protein